MKNNKIDLTKLITYDIETLKNCFICCCKDYKTGAKKEFIIHEDSSFSDQPLKFFSFIKNCIKSNYTFVGFNSLGFDSQVVHEYYDWCSQRRDPLHTFEPRFIAEQLYKKAQKLINAQDNEGYKDIINESKLFAPQIDLYKQKHYDRPQRATSLKWIQFGLRLPNIQEMPIDHTEEVTVEQIPSIVEYCWNDVDSTEEFFKKILFETELRLQIGTEYNLNLINASEPKMVREIFGKFLCKEMNISYDELKKLQTIRDKVVIRDIIFPYVKYQSPLFQKVLDVFNLHVVTTDPNYSWKSNELGPKFNVKEDNDIALAKLREETKDYSLTRDESKFGYSFKFQDMDVYLGLGGIHACIKSGVYVPSKDEVIEDADGTSFYPMLAIKNKLKPKHLGDTFSSVYPMIFEERQKYSKKDPRNYIFKIILNSAYGLSKEVNSYLYDPQFTYGITLNGQLTLLMLVEALYMSVPNIKFLQMNTDGITYVYNKKYTDIVRKICKWWEKTTKIDLEYAYYEKMVIMDVNNYLAIKNNYTKYATQLKNNEKVEGYDNINSLNKDYIKKKGLFETEKDYHKNPSNLIIPKALEQYYINNTPVKEFISSNNTIFDFCSAVKKKSNFTINHERLWGGNIIIEPQQKVTRFFISTTTDNSGFLYKNFKDGRKVSIMAGQPVICCNKLNLQYNNAKDYPINYNWYISQTQDVINLISPPVVQQTLF